MIEQN